MSTRFATFLDTPELTNLLLEFGREARVGFRSARNDDQQRLSRMLGAWMRDHYVRVAEHNNEIVGLLVAERGLDFWDPERRILQERVWYVRPEYRNSRASAGLWSAWQQDSDQYVKSGTVDMVMMSTQGPTTRFDPGRRGWRLIEQTWIKE